MDRADRLLHRTHGYTSDPTRALFAEPEALTADQLDELASRAERRARDAQLQEWRDRRQQIIRELDWLASQRFQRDVTTQVRAVRRQLDRVDARLAL